MKKIEVKTPVDILEYSELNEADALLVEEARKATFRAYAPYSHFNVGAAIRLDNGVTVTGANQENAAYPSGTCAERSACYYAHATYPDSAFEAIAVAARGADGEFTTDLAAPCGACRQALLEYETLAGHDVPVFLAAADKVYVLPSVKAMLPLAFCEIP